MLKFLFVLLIFTSMVYGSDKVEIYAASMDSKDNIVNAYGDVSVVYKDYYISAKRAVYNRLSGDLELFENIRITQGSTYKLLGKYAKLNIANKERTFRPLFMLENTSQVWVSADDGCSEDDRLDIRSGIMSGCDPNDPLWKMEFTSSDYNTKSKWLNLYNARIYIYDIPVLYTPYFGYSLDTSRTTGLLTPSLNISDKEGFYYEQSIYIAKDNWWDLELKPQMRTNRGYGGYAIFRFVDSRISKGKFTTGYFQEKQKYFINEQLVYDTHYGFNFEYENTDFINQWFGTDYTGQSAFYIDINNMNDVDYINLSTNDTTKNVTATQVLSRGNLFYNTDKNYFGGYVKYYKDLTKQSNADTLQQLPTFHYHYYLDTLFNDNILYNLNVQSNNIYRDTGKKVIQTDFNAPITLHTSLFDEYLNLSYSAQFYAQHSAFSGSEETSSGNYISGVFFREYNVLQASTQLTRAYDGFTHVMDFGSQYTLSGTEYRNGFYDEKSDFCSDIENKHSSECEFYNITDVDEELQLNFAQYFFDLEGRQKVHHRISQVIAYENSKSKFGELENEVDYQISKGFNYYNNMFYNYDEKSFSKMFNKVSYRKGGVDIAFSHLYKDTFISSSETYSPFTSYITSSLRYTYNEHYSYHAKWDYDLETSLKKSAEIGFLYKKRCWDFGIRYIENNRPVLTQSNASSVYDRYVYFTIALKPLMQSTSTSSDFAARLPDALRGF